MKTLHQIPELRALIADWRRAGDRVALVPTMGNLHAGHLNLVEQALTQADRVVTSLFVNPLQFGPNEDLDAYPRTLARDTEILAAAGNHCLFAPNEAEVYPDGREGRARVEVPGFSDILCGAARPGHFTGVATVVTKLFNMVQPEVALFGKKDFQQLLVIRRLCRDLNLDIEIIGCATVREADGLAMSSRNAYLSPKQRAQAPQLYAQLQQAADAVRLGEALPAIEREASQQLAALGFSPDYVSIRRQEDLAEPSPDDRSLVILAAARLGKARLIDNLEVERSQAKLG